MKLSLEKVSLQKRHPELESGLVVQMPTRQLAQTTSCEVKSWHNEHHWDGSEQNHRFEVSGNSTYIGIVSFFGGWGHQHRLLFILSGDEVASLRPEFDVSNSRPQEILRAGFSVVSICANC